MKNERVTTSSLDQTDNTLDGYSKIITSKMKSVHFGSSKEVWSELAVALPAAQLAAQLAVPLKALRHCTAGSAARYRAHCAAAKVALIGKKTPQQTLRAYASAAGGAHTSTEVAAKLIWTDVQYSCTAPLLPCLIQ
jgi:hypothetical protein